MPANRPATVPSDEHPMTPPAEPGPAVSRPEARWAPWVAWLFVAAGTLVRIIGWWHSYPLGVDERLVVISLAFRDPIAMFKPLWYGQMAPPFWLFFMNPVVHAAGPNDSLLELPSLAAGVASL